MNWLIQKKIFTYFYNKFRPVNRMHYIKCGANISLLTQFWLLQKVCGNLDHCFIMTHIIHNEGDILQIYYCVIFRKTRHHAEVHVTSGTFIGCMLSLATGRTQTAAEFDGWFHWPCWLWQLPSCTTFVPAALCLPTCLGVGWSWLVTASSIKFLTRRSLKSWCIYLAPHKDNRIQLLRIVRSRRWKNNFVVHLKMCRLID